MKPLVVIAGPTACGKTAAGVHLAKRINGEIISADSMQVYKYMDIGTAKPTHLQMQGVKHYLIDELMPDEEYSMAVFLQKARGYAQEIYEKGKTPILVGGTGFYINAFINGTEIIATHADVPFRDHLYAMARDEGNEAVYKMLSEADPGACEKIHPNNLKRVIRALEYFNQTGRQISVHNQEQKQKTAVYDMKFFILSMQREKLYRRIEERIDEMMDSGLTDEVKMLLDRGYHPGLTSMKGLGYKELVPYVQGIISFQEAVDTLKRNTRHFAKRQVTWFRHQNNGVWIDIDESDKLDIIYR